MFGILKKFVSYVNGQKNSDTEEVTSDNTHSDDLFSAKQLADLHSDVYQELENSEFLVEKIEEEVRAIEGLEEEEKQINGKMDFVSLKENVPLLTLEEPISLFGNKSNSAISTAESKEEEIGCSSNNGLELCQHRIGKITKSFKDYAVIDDEIRVDFHNLHVKSLLEGASVKYVVFRKHAEDEWHFHKMMEIEEENWEGQVKEIKTEIVKKSGAINRKIIGVVEFRAGQEVTVKPDIKFSLDDVKADFIPYTGDWLSINALVELDASVQDFVGEVLAIHDIKPLRSRIISGFITSWDENRKEGIVDKNVWFTQNECEPGYLPACEDSVAVEAIECTHDFCIWRAVSVVSNDERKVKTNHNPPTIDEERNIRKSALPCIKNGISVPRKVNFGSVNFGKSKEGCIEVINVSKDSCTLVRGKFHGKKSESQLTLLSDISGETLISPGQKILCRFCVRGRFLGQFTEYFVFQFQGFKMSCAINFEVCEDNIMSLIGNKRQFCANLNDKLARTRNKEFNRKEKTVMRGQQIMKPTPFVPIKFGSYLVPEHLWKVVLGDNNDDCTQAKIIERLRKVAPCVNGDLSPRNYIDRFHTLLYVEEINMNIQMHRYDLEGVSLSFVGNEYLSLEVPGLAEKRPSVLVGDKVNLESSKNPGPVYEGFVHKVCTNELWLKFHPHFHQTYESEECSVSFVISRNPMRRCHYAVELAMKHLGEKVLFPKCLIEKEPQVNLIDEDKEDSTVQNPYNYKIKPFASGSEVIRPQKVIYSDTGAPVYPMPGTGYFPRLPAPKISKKRVQLKWFNSQLNHYQKEAVRNALKGECRPLPYVIFGPPGTGKTVTLVETILQIYSLIPDSRILVATPSNSSANLIAERLLISKVLAPGDLVRLAAWHCFEEGTIPESLLPYSTSCDVAACKPGESNPITYKLKRSSNASVLGRHRITVGTCIALGQLYTMGFPSGHFTHVCVDEAGQATEPELVIPLAFLHHDWGQAILAGDPMQLGPVISSRISALFGLGYSYLARLLDSPLYFRDPSSFSSSDGYNPKLVTRLVMNYRSLPEILNLPSSLFYDSHLQPQVEETGREVAILKSIAKYLPQRNSSLPPSIVFHGIRGRNFQESDCPSWFNPQELVQIVFYLKDLLQAGLSPDDIGVITPYQKQVQKLRSLLNQLEMPSPKIGSVEEFQGQERQVILLSTVRSAVKLVKLDVRHCLGFVASPQRLNVALTRARALLIIVGNPHLLSRDFYWRKTLSYCIDNNAYVGCDLPKDFLEISCKFLPTDGVEQEQFLCE